MVIFVHTLGERTAMHISEDFSEFYVPNNLGMRSRYLVGLASEGKSGWSTAKVNGVQWIRFPSLLFAFVFTIPMALFFDAGVAWAGFAWLALISLIVIAWVVAMVFGVGYEAVALKKLVKKHKDDMFHIGSVGYKSLERACSSPEVFKYIFANETLLVDYLVDTTMERHALETHPIVTDTAVTDPKHAARFERVKQSLQSKAQVIADRAKIEWQATQQPAVSKYEQEVHAWDALVDMTIPAQVTA